MGIVQDTTGIIGRPDVNVTDYGAGYVKAATETPTAPPVEANDADLQQEQARESQEEKPRKKGGRPKKKQ